MEEREMTYDEVISYNKLLKEELNNLQQELDKLKAKLENQTKEYQKILREQQNEIDQLERNCDVFNEQMNNAVERTVELNKQKQNLKEWLEEEIKRLDTIYENLTDAGAVKMQTLKEVLERLGE